MRQVTKRDIKGLARRALSLEGLKWDDEKLDSWAVVSTKHNNV